MLAQFKPTMKTQGNLLHMAEYLVPCVPVKRLDIETLHSDFMDTLRMMYYDQETQGQLYSFSDVKYKKLNASQLEEMHNTRVLVKAYCEPAFV